MLQCMKCKWCIFVREMFDTISNNSTLIIVSNVRDDLLLVPDEASTETILSHFIYMLLVSGESRGWKSADAVVVSAKSQQCCCV